MGKNVEGAQGSQIQQIIKEQVEPIQGGLANTLAMVFALLVAIAVKDVFNPWIKRQTLKISFNKEQDREIDQILTILLSVTNSDRVLLTRFTNGIYTIDGASIKGCVVTHEVTQIGVTKVTGLVNGRIGDYSNVILKSFIAAPYITRVTDEIKDDSFRAFSEELGNKFSIHYFLTAKDLPLGFLSFHWRSLNNRMDYEAVSQHDLRSYADALTSRLLSNQSVISKFIKALPKP